MTMHSKNVLGISLGIINPPCTGTSITYPIGGQVTDNASGSPIAGYTIHILDSTKNKTDVVTTNDNGYFCDGNLVGKYEGYAVRPASMQEYGYNCPSDYLCNTSSPNPLSYENQVGAAGNKPNCTTNCNFQFIKAPLPITAPTAIPTPTPVCLPHPACLDAKPFPCEIAEPASGWCLSQITPSSTPSQFTQPTTTLTDTPNFLPPDSYDRSYEYLPPVSEDDSLQATEITPTSSDQLQQTGDINQNISSYQAPLSSGSNPIVSNILIVSNFITSTVTQGILLFFKFH